MKSTLEAVSPAPISDDEALAKFALAMNDMLNWLYCERLLRDEFHKAHVLTNSQSTDRSMTDRRSSN